MSATNRGSKRVESDFYATPLNVIDNLLSHHQLKDGIILEPSAGNGNFIRSIRNNGYINNVIANELRTEEINNLLNSGANIVTNMDYLSDEFEIPNIDNKKVETVIGNPPFSLAKEFLEVTFNRFPNAEIIMLLRLAFLESKKRYDFWKKHPVSKLYVLSERPSFTGRGTDATAYCFMVWNKSSTQEIRVI
ncbi:hypothetical protein [Robertmurraya siralis]|uniref:hypothetical protein n=1 Tax=Robertmurraya siralis TaxID=77777 RepID=UPI0010F9867A|nr:hypothetical protein [Robertmurraya siralis]